VKKLFNKTTLALAAAAFLLTGCWDNVELENRAFVTAAAIDKNDDGNFKASMEVPKVSSEKSVVTEKTVESNESNSLSKALYGTDNFTDKSIYLGHMKMAVLSEDLLSDEKLFKQAADTLLRDRDISRKLILLSSKKEAADIIEAETDNEKLVGVYIANFYKKNNPSINYRQDLDKITKNFAEDGHAIIPQITLEDKNLKLSGAAVLKDYTLKGWLSDDELNGLLWMYSKAKGTKLEAGNGDKQFVVNIDKYKSDMAFFEQNGIIYANTSITAEVTVDEASEALLHTDNYTAFIVEESKKKITEEVNKAYDALYNNMGVDGFNMESTLKKKEETLHKIYFENMGTTIDKVPVMLDISISINSTGAIN